MEELQSINRRKFLKQAGTLLASSSVASALPLSAWAQDSKLIQLTVLHTNDVHSRIEPFPMDGSRNQGMGGAARRAALIGQIRQEQRNVLLLDAGDTVQGTPYFNLYGGQLEMELMSKMGYDASTFGNHEFDNGVDHLAGMIKHANFPFLNSNYDFSGTAMEGKALPYKVFTRQKIKIGVFGLGIELSGLVDPLLSAGVRYMDPIPVAQNMVDKLRNAHKCDLVICLSHLGYQMEEGKVSDRILAANTQGIDLIIGGHTHTFLPEPVQIQNLSGEYTLVNQVGYAGINLGRIDFLFERKTGKKQKYIAHLYEINESSPATVLV